VAGFHDTSFRDAYFTNKRVNQEGKYGEYGVVPYQPPTCPECSSTKVWKDGFRSDSLIPIQRWLCRDCGYRFSSSSLINKKEIRQTSECRVRVSDNEMVNLATVETRISERAAGATKITDNATLKGKIIEFLWYLKKEGYSKETVKTYVNVLVTLNKRGADIFNPESVKEVISEQTEQKRWGEGRKANVIKAYTAFLRMQNCEWKKPRYKFKKGLPRPPTPEQVKQLIAGASRKYASIFRFMAETGASPIETSILTERSYDFERNTVYIEGKKGHLDRIIPITEELSVLMKEYLTKYGSFPSSIKISQKWRKYRDRLSQKLNDKALRNIRLYDLRHYFGTMAYAQTKDILWVKDKMGHTKLETTMIYTKLLAYPIEEEFICRAAETVEDAEKLIEAGFEYVTNINSIKLFRKRKSFFKGSWSNEKGSESSEKGLWSSLV